jgi:hypothetical protein
VLIAASVPTLRPIFKVKRGQIRDGGSAGTGLGTWNRSQRIKMSTNDDSGPFVALSEPESRDEADIGVQFKSYDNRGYQANAIAGQKAQDHVGDGIRRDFTVTVVYGKQDSVDQLVEGQGGEDVENDELNIKPSSKVRQLPEMTGVAPAYSVACRIFVPDLCIPVALEKSSITPYSRMASLICFNIAGHVVRMMNPLFPTLGTYSRYLCPFPDLQHIPQTKSPMSPSVETRITRMRFLGKS